MGGSSKQTIGYQYFSFFLLFIGNPIEKMLGINFDKRGWHTPLIDKMGNPLSVGVIEKATLYGENEGGVAGQIHARYGTENQEVVSFYKEYMESKGLQASAYPYQSYLAFPDFYVGNSGYMKEMLLWPKRTRIRNDGRRQWYEVRGDGAVVCEIGAIISIPYIEGITTYVPDSCDTTCKYSFTNFQNTSGTSYGFVYNDWVGNKFTIPLGRIQAGGELDDNITESEQWTIDIPPGYPYLEIIGSFAYVSDSYNLQFENAVFFEKWSGGVDGIYKKVHVRAIVDVSSGFLNYTFSRTGHVAGAFYANSALKGSPVNQAVCRDPNGLDINPIHKIREILTDDTAMNKSELSVNNDNFVKAADRIWDEGLGISWSITEKSCIDAINELCYHIEAGIRVNRQTGLYEMVLFRDDWLDENEIHAIAESKIKSMQYEITNADEVINQVNVNYYDRANIKNSSFSISENGLIQTLGRVNAETLDFPYFMNMRNAEVVANWKLKQLSTGAFKGSFTTGWREARKWNRYDLIRLPWSKRWTGTILVRIMGINLGGPTNNEVSIEFIEVVPSTGMMNTTIVIDDPIDKPLPPQPCNAKVFELPYFEAVQAFGEREVGVELTDNPEIGYLCAIAEKPQNNSLNAAFYADGMNGFERVATINYCETAYLDQAIDRMSGTFVVKNVSNIASVRTGSQIYINDEIMVYQSYDPETKVLTVKRGAFDSIPQNHIANSILYFADDFIAIDQTLYVEGEAINAKVLTTTPSGVLDLSSAATHEVDFGARAIRPYPPANVKINSKYWPDEPLESIILTWVDRNRLQQTGGEIIGWFDGGVMVENEVTYSLELEGLDENHNVISTAIYDIGMVNTYELKSFDANPVKVRLKLFAEREGFKSYQAFEHIVTLNLAFTAPYNLTAEYIE